MSPIMANLIVKLAISRPKFIFGCDPHHRDLQELQHVRAEHLGADWINLNFLYYFLFYIFLILEYYIQYQGLYQYWNRFYGKTYFIELPPGMNCIRIGLPGKSILRDYQYWYSPWYYIQYSNIRKIQNNKQYKKLDFSWVIWNISYLFLIKLVTKETSRC